MPFTTFYRRTVGPQDCDHLGHMNVARYFDACSDSGFALQALFGLTAEDVAAGRRLSLVVVTLTSDFQAEVHLGEAIRMETGIGRIGSKSLHLHHRLYAGHPERLAFTSTFKAVLLSLDTRRAVVIPDDLRAAMAPYMLTEEDQT